ncbi:MAG: dihydrofolate reductase [Pseudomonadales bacterium]
MNKSNPDLGPQTNAGSAGLCLSLISAMASNRVIGRDNDLPWRLPEDMRHFMRTTLGKPVIMGRKTYESMGKPLPGRCNIVVSRSLAPPPGVQIAKSLEDALQQAEAECRDSSTDEYFIIGGAQLYAASLPLAQRLYLTWVHADVVGDTFFPEFDLDAWREVRREDFPASATRIYAFSIAIYERASS